MTLIKYYKPDTCYDGKKEFTKANGNSSRYYPDEYLIATILEKYHQKRFPDSKQIIVLTEPWLNDQVVTRNGGANTGIINNLILQKIELAEKNTLLLVPFLYGYHHPGISIDISNKTAIYLDPYGHNAHYPEVRTLQELLLKKGFKVLTVTTEQQKRTSDFVSCGPILTASMIKFMEEFMVMGSISVNDFKAPRPNLGTERLFQMYVNNNALKEGQYLVDEVMLADEALWNKVFQEQKLPEPISQKIVHALKEQKQFIQSLPENWKEDPSQKFAVEFIKNFQSYITECLFLNERDIVCEIDLLVDVSNHLFQKKDLCFDESCLTDLFIKQDLLSDDHVAHTHRVMGLMDYSKKIEENILNFEKTKEKIQEHFKLTLNALKNRLDALSKKDVGLKEKGQVLYDALFSNQQEFFKSLDVNSNKEEIEAKIKGFRETCKEHITIADKIMGHGKLYHVAEVLIKAIVGLFAGIGMILGSVIGEGLAKSEHRQQFAKTFFTLNQNEYSLALNTFKQEALDDCLRSNGANKLL